MLDFVEIISSSSKTSQSSKKGKTEKPEVIDIFPDFKTYGFYDLMIKGGKMYAFWNSKKNYWDTDIGELGRIIDEMIYEQVDKIQKENELAIVRPKFFSTERSNVANRFQKYIKLLPDNWKQLDNKVIFANDKVKRTDYATFSLDYSLEDGSIESYEELVNTLYDPVERRKFEWAIGSIIAGDSVDIQKFYVFYGTAGSGKSTILKVIETIFDGYWKSFKSEELGNSNSSFNMEALKDNPLVSIDHEGKLDRIDNNTVLNSIISHDDLIVNVKFAAKYQMKFTTTMFIGSNNPVKITDSKSGLIRRLIDISPSGRLLPFSKYTELMERIDFEKGAIAKHCLEVYLKYGKNYYGNYKPTSMISETNDIYNFVSEMLWEWEESDSVSLAKAWSDYIKWCEDAKCRPYMKRNFKVELLEYFEDFIPRIGTSVNVYKGIKFDKFGYTKPVEDEEITSWLDLKEGIPSVFDKDCSDCFAQYASEDEIPETAWKNVTSKLSELDTSRLHYVKVPLNHIVIDFDIKNEKGEKDYVLNMRAASKFPKTYAELSKGGQGIHLHYIYLGDVSKLSAVYDADIEVKTFRGGASLRRKLTKCNDIPIAGIGSGLPLKEEKAVVSKKVIENERHLITMVKKCLNKEFQGHTAPEIDFIKHLTDQAYATDNLSYDIRSLKPAIVSFAMNSSNQAQKCFNTVTTMHLCSKDVEENEILYFKKVGDNEWKEAPIVFFDVEVFPNLFVICWKIIGSENVNVMVNPSPKEVEQLFKYRLVGFYNRGYDNHIIYARAMGYSLEELYNLSQRLVGGSRNAKFASAYGLSYTDILDYCSNKNKMSLKKWEIKLGIYHLENAYPWNKPIDKSHWDEIVNYCKNDVIATEAVWNATQDDFTARCILAELSGLTVNDTSNSHTQQYIFGDDKHPQSQFNCPDLREEFPGYEYVNGVSTYLGEKVSEGGWVFFKPGMYAKVKCFDVSGMHPHSAYKMKVFGDYYTERYYDLVRARTYIKHKEYDKVRKMFDGRLAKYLEDDKSAKALSNALKTPINAVYGLTAASYDNRCRDPRNKENIVAKRGALFMITLKHKLDDMGYEVIHCKTDSIKVVNPDEKVEKFILEFGKKYGYDFEVEDVFDRICLVNGSTFIALTPDKVWEAKAAQFAHPYVFKSLFSHEVISFKDLCETKSVDKGAMYLDYNESLPSVKEQENQLKKVIKDNPNDISLIDKLTEDIRKGHDYKFVGKVGLFTPIKSGMGGGLLMVRKDPDVEKYDYVTGTKISKTVKDKSRDEEAYRWFESEFIKANGLEDDIDMRYFDSLVEDAISNISKYGDFDIFANGSDYEYFSYLELRDSEYEKIPA